MEHLPENNTGKKNLCFTQDNEGKITGSDFSSEVWLDKTGLMASGQLSAQKCALVANGPYNVSAG